MKLTVIVTVFNEKKTILAAIEAIKNISVEKQIIIVDNCSTDGTKELLKNLNDNSLQIAYQPENYGYGKSVITGMNLAKGKYLFVHYSDLEYDPICVYEMLELAEKENLDAVFGSRLFNRSNESRLKIIKERPFNLGTIITTILTNYLYKTKFTDIIGNKFYRNQVLKEINPQALGMDFEFEVVSKLCKGGFKIKEIPVQYSPRTEGKKVKVYDIFPAILTILKIKYFG